MAKGKKQGKLSDGGVWKKESKKGTKYLQLSVDKKAVDEAEVYNGRITINLFKTDSDNDKAPLFSALVSRPMNGKGKPAPKQRQEEETDEDDSDDDLGI